MEVGVSFEEDSNFWCILFANFFPIGRTVEKEFLILVLVDLGHFGKTMRASTPHTNTKLDPVGSTVRYEMMKLCTGSV